MAENRQDMRYHLWGFGVAALVLTWAATPLLRYAPPINLFGYGFYTGLVLICLWERESNTKLPPKTYRVFVDIVLALAVVTSLYHAAQVLTISLRGSRANDQRCEAIQHDMLSASPRRTDSPDLFQALGCRPQGEGSVYAKPRPSPHAVGLSAKPNRG